MCVPASYYIVCILQKKNMPSVTAAGVQVNFPFDPYPCQVTYMEKVITCLQQVNYCHNVLNKCSEMVNCFRY